MKSRKEQKRILVAIEQGDHRLQRGIERYALERGWHLCPQMLRGKMIPWGWEGDGILTCLSGESELATFIAQTNVPTVDFGSGQFKMKVPQIIGDHAHAARLAAEYFLARHFLHHIYYSSVENQVCEERGHQYLKFVQEAGRKCEWLRWSSSADRLTGRQQLKARLEWLALCLKRAAKPLAVFSANDHHALEILDACELANLEVPEEVAILGADNCLLAADALRIPISSVDTNWEAIGYRGAKLLERLMNGKPSPKLPIRIPALGVVERGSSAIPQVLHRGVANSLRFIHKQLCEPISVGDIAAAAAMSRCALHKAFLEHLRQTPRQALRQIRIERGKQLLTTSNLEIKKIVHLCGYQSAASFSAAFSLLTGMAPDRFRRKSRVEKNRFFEPVVALSRSARGGSRGIGPVAGNNSGARMQILNIGLQNRQLIYAG